MATCMNESIKVNVTSYDIKCGIPGSHRECALARACRRHFGSDGDVSVYVIGDGIHSYYALINWRRFEIEPGSETEKFILDFDRRHDTRPFTAVLLP